jgi:hypothetical protein
MVNTPLDFLKDYQKGIYKMGFNAAAINEGALFPFDQEIYERMLKSFYNDSNNFISTPNDFFERWLNTRLGITPNLPHYLDSPGFDLEIPYIRTGRLDNLIIASDLSYGDFKEDLVFVINHLPSERVLVYKDVNQEFYNTPHGEKKLVSQMIYPWGGEKGKEEYPFRSFAPGKAVNCTWSLINISPNEVYNSLRKIGFTW